MTPLDVMLALRDAREHAIDHDEQLRREGHVVARITATLPMETLDDILMAFEDAVLHANAAFDAADVAERTAARVHKMNVALAVIAVVQAALLLVWIV